MTWALKLLGGLSWRTWGALALAALLGGLWWRGNAAKADLVAAKDKAATIVRETQANEAITKASQAGAIQLVTFKAAAAASQARVDRDGADAAVRVVVDRLRGATFGGGQQAGVIAIGSAGLGGGDAGHLQTSGGLFERCAEVTGIVGRQLVEVSAYADRLRAAGEGCEAVYESLTPKVTP